MMKTKATAADYRAATTFVIVCAIIAAIMALLTDERPHGKRAYKPSPFIIRIIRKTGKFYSRMFRKILEFYSRMFQKIQELIIHIFWKKTAKIDPMEDPLEAVIKEQIKNTPEEDVVHLDELDQFFGHRYDDGYNTYDDGYNTDPIVIND